MKMKQCIFVIVTIFSLSFSACKNKENEEMHLTREYVQGYIADNSKSLSAAFSREYTIEELKGYFGEVSTNEFIGFSNDENGEPLTICDVNRIFPIECLRFKQFQDDIIEAYNCYTVYKVSEGGYFYVFWSRNYNQFIDMTLEDDKDATVYFTAYISSLKKASDFNSIKEGLSTAEDVGKIASAFELDFLVSNGIYSYSLLDDNTIMEIKYSHVPEMESRKDLVVESKTIRENDRGYLSAIMPSDLP